MIDHIVDENGHLMSLNQIKQSFPHLRTNFLTHQRLVSAVPNAWRTKLQQDPGGRMNPEFVNDIVFINQDDKPVPIKHCGVRNFYAKQLTNRLPTAIARWESYDVRPPNWRAVFEIPYKCTISTKIQSLHFRIINRYVPTRKFLSTRGIIGSPMCTHCFQVDDMRHFFYECDKVKPLWMSILPQLKTIFRLGQNLSEYKTIILGFPNAPPVVNLILLLTKQYIVKCKLNRDETTNPNLNCLRNEISTHCYTEGTIAKNKNKIEKHINKWKSLWSGDVPLDRHRSPCRSLGGGEGVRENRVVSRLLL